MAVLKWVLLPNCQVLGAICKGENKVWECLLIPGGCVEYVKREYVYIWDTVSDVLEICVQLEVIYVATVTTTSRG